MQVSRVSRSVRGGLHQQGGMDAAADARFAGELVQVRTADVAQRVSNSVVSQQITPHHYTNTID